jgi:ribonucleoside-triphosphate reductase
MTTAAETTDLTLFVRTSGEEIARWDRRRIVEALIREAAIDESTAEAISREVEKQIVASGIGLLTTALVRELVDAKLIERGMEQARRLHARLGFPRYDVRQLILHQNKENANVPHPGRTTRPRGDQTRIRPHDVFSREVGDAHVSGDLHLHGLGYIDRPYSACQSLEYIKRFGLKLPHSVTVAGPARHAEVLLAHMVRFGASLQGHFAGVIGWDAVNLAFAPYLTGRGRDVEQFAQMLVYNSQLTSYGAGDLHRHPPGRFPVFRPPAIGPGEAHREELPGVWEESQTRPGTHERLSGRRHGQAVHLPKPIIHITDEFFQTPAMRFLEEACGVAARGNLFRPRPGAQHAWLLRAIQNVTLNLPRLGYRAVEDDRTLFDLLDQVAALAATAHVQKRAFIEQILSLGDAGPGHACHAERRRPLSPDGRCHLSHRGDGLNELVQIRKGRQL